jgi:hypothetical protein
MKVIHAIFKCLYYPQVFVLKALIFIAPLDKFNTVIQLKLKLARFRKTDELYRQLVEVEKEPQETDRYSHLDLHYQKLAQYVKYMSLVTQLVIDVVFGVALLLTFCSYPHFFLEAID